jgi:hypothetical protein
MAMASNLGFQRVNEWNGLRGFANLFRKENRAWWSTRRWLLRSSGAWPLFWLHWRSSKKRNSSADPAGKRTGA